MDGATDPAALSADELLELLLTRIRAAIGPEHGDPERAAAALGIDSSNISRWFTRTQRVSAKMAQRLDEVYTRPDGLTFVQLRRWWRDAVERDAGSVGVGAVGGPYDAETAYTVVADILSRFAPTDPDARIIRLAELHGHSGPRLEDVQPQDVPPPSPAAEAFDAAIRDLILRTGQRSCAVRQLFTITSETRLDHMLDVVEGLTKAPRYEVRAYVAPDTLPVLIPLIVGQTDVFLGIDDERVYRIESAVRITSREIVRWAATYYDRLWDNAHVVRTAIGLNNDGIERLRRDLAKSSRSTHRTHRTDR